MPERVFKNIFRNKVRRALLLMLGLLLMGSVGYRFMSDDYSWIEALYMTVITITTVGFSEVHHSDDSVKLFTIFLIITSISIYAYIVSVVSEYIAQGRFFEQLKNRKMQKKIFQLKGHIIICGYGRNGRQAVERLKSYDKQCVIIETNDEIVEEIESYGYKYIKGDATDDRTLEEANIKEASYLITALPSDADNLFVVLSARQLNPKLKIISRASKDSTYTKLKLGGADNIIMPDKIGGSHMASLIVTPDLVEFVDQLNVDGKHSTNLEEIAVNDLPKEYINKTLLNLNLRKKTGCSVIGFKNAAHQYIINPDVNTVLEPDSYLIVLGKHNQIKKLQEVF
ncbi:MAG: potassium channel protein [Flavobacteriia bacterium]|nr:MAG: potassium channel protein [Flavobacteriia bacterium]